MQTATIVRFETASPVLVTKMQTATVVRYETSSPILINNGCKERLMDTLATLCERGYVALTSGRFNRADALFTYVIDACEAKGLIFHVVYAKALFGRASAAHRNIFHCSDDNHITKLVDRCVQDTITFQVYTGIHSTIDWSQEINDCVMFLNIARDVISRI